MKLDPTFDPKIPGAMDAPRECLEAYRKFDRWRITPRVLDAVNRARKRGRTVRMRAFGNLTLRVLGVATAGCLIYFG